MLQKMKVVGFGNNICGQLGNGRYCGRERSAEYNVPFHIQSSSIGYGHSAFITDEHDLYLCGWNTYGQLSSKQNSNSNSNNTETTLFNSIISNYTDDNGFITTPCFIPEFAGNCAQVACGGGFTLVLDRQGRVYNCGANDCCQLGDGSQENRFSWQQVHGLGSFRIQSIAAGSCHSFALNENGELYGWGKNDAGQLGIGSATFAERRPIKINTLNSFHIDRIFTKFTHCFATTKCGKVFGFGYNFCGQLANDQMPFLSMGGPDHHRKTLFKENVLTPQHIETLGPADEIRDIATGELHTCILKKNGELWFIGSDSQQTCFSLQKVHIWNNKKPIGSKYRNCYFSHVVAGQDFTLAITDNKVLSWGSNGQGQLGFGNEDRKWPKEVRYLRGEVNAIVCGWNATICFWKRQHESTFNSDLTNMFNCPRESHRSNLLLNTLKFT
eukprot:gb/GECH01003650.1/.p1 GENE.gb/GECH01003650.1/~~gb/GECH01003650.1/.p1  ORF type:complete len:441 (+),score=87.90 gb/GECH01003650.1/:1-1323(+)